MVYLLPGSRRCDSGPRDIFFLFFFLIVEMLFGFSNPEEQRKRQADLSKTGRCCRERLRGNLSQLSIVDKFCYAEIGNLPATWWKSLHQYLQGVRETKCKVNWRGLRHTIQHMGEVEGFNRLKNVLKFERPPRTTYGASNRCNLRQSSFMGFEKYHGV